MKNYFFPALLSGLLLGGCTSAYRTGQTPDDLYFSAAPEVRDEARVYSRPQPQQEEYSSYWSNAEEDYLRMKVRNRNRWSNIDDYNYWNNFNSMSMAGAFNNPFCTPGGFGSKGLWGMSNQYNYNNASLWNNNYGYSPFNSGWGYNNYGWNNGGYAGMNGYGSNGYGYNGYGYNRPVIYVVSDKNNASGRNTFRPGLGAYSNTFYEKGSATRSSGYKPGSTSTSGSLFRSIFSEGSSGGSGNSSYDKSARSLNAGANNSGSTNSNNSSSGSSSGSSRSSSGTTTSSRGGRGG